MDWIGFGLKMDPCPTLLPVSFAVVIEMTFKF